MHNLIQSLHDPQNLGIALWLVLSVVLLLVLSCRICGCVRPRKIRPNKVDASGFEQMQVRTGGRHAENGEIATTAFVGRIGWGLPPASAAPRHSRPRIHSEYNEGSISKPLFTGLSVSEPSSENRAAPQRSKGKAAPRWWPGAYSFPLE
jgi:hypothetical protein